MLTTHDQKILAYTRENNNGKCLFSAKKCDGLCNNCGIDYLLEMENAKRNGTHLDYHSAPHSRNNYDNNDYEGAILARQELQEL